MRTKDAEREQKITEREGEKSQVDREIRKKAKSAGGTVSMRKMECRVRKGGEMRKKKKKGEKNQTEKHNSDSEALSSADGP